MFRIKKNFLLAVLALVFCAIFMKRRSTFRHNSGLHISGENVLPQGGQEKADIKTFHHFHTNIITKPLESLGSLVVKNSKKRPQNLKHSLYIMQTHPPTSGIKMAHTNGDEIQNKSNTTANSWKRTAKFVNVSGIYVYGAYLDKREDRMRTVHLLALRQRDVKDSLMCQITDNGKDFYLYSVPYKMCENHGKLYEGWIYSCTLPENVQKDPSHISILSLSQRLHPQKVLATILLTTIPAKTKLDAKNIGVCVPPLFGNISLSSVINFIEMCKLLGADQLMLYLASTSAEITTFLAHHSKQDGAVSLIQWDLPSEVTTPQDRIWYHGQQLAIQDCLYHNMGKFRFLLFMDLDEMLVPQHFYYWTDMIRRIITSEHTDQVAALSFRSAFFDPQHPPEDGETTVYFQHLRRTRAVSTVRNKLIVQPLKVFELGIHHLSKAVSDKYKALEVSHNQALIYHYNTCVQTYEPSMKCYPTVKDTTMLKYKDRLTQRTHLILTDASKLFA